MAHSVGLGKDDGDDPIGWLPLADVQSCLPSGGVLTVSLFGGSCSLSSVDARPSLPSVGAQVNLLLVDI